MQKQKKETVITVEEWLEELARGTGTDDGHMTVAEICESVAADKFKVRRALAEAKRAGRLSMRIVQRETLDGRKASVPAYKVVK